MEGFEDMVVVKDPRRTPAKRKRDTTIFKKDVWSDPRIAKLSKHGSEIQKHSLLTTAYWIPIKVLTHLKIRSVLYDTLTARPKAKKFQGKDTRHPWPIWHERGEFVAIPRQFGLRVFGKPSRVNVSDGEAIDVKPQKPLFNAETCKASKGIDQETAVNKVEQYLKSSAEKDGFASCLFCISPGFGKTCCSAHLIARLGGRALFVVPNEKPFLKQVADEMRTFLGKDIIVGQLLTSDKRKWKHLEDAHIVITTSKSIATIPYDLTSFRTVVIDEAHETSTAVFSQMYFRFNAKYVLGLTATPERAGDQCGGYLQWLSGPVAWYEQRDVSQLRWGGVKVTIYDMCYTDHPIEEKLMSTGEPYWEAMTRQIMAKPSRNKFLLSVLLDRHRVGRHILVLGSRIEHMERIHNALVTHYKIPCGIIVGQHSPGYQLPSLDEKGEVTRRLIRSAGLTAEERLEQQKFKIIIASVAIVSKALNIPSLDTLMVLSGGTNVNDTFWRQASGRIGRDHATKQMPEIILFRDRYESKVNPGSDGVFAGCVDAACNTLRKQSKEGYTFTTIPVELS